MIYGYIRVSTDKQTVENQRFEINTFVEREGIILDRWIEETISGTKEVEKRLLGKLLKKLKKGDVLICAELSRLGRSMLMIMNILHHCMKNEIEVWTIKDNFRLGKDIQSQVLAFAFGLSAQIERDLISMRTKEALARKKSEGIVLGRPVGTKNKAVKLSGMERRVQGYLDAGLSFSAIGRLLGVHRLTVSNFVKEKIENNNVKGTDEIEVDPITSRQLNKLLEQKSIVLHLLMKKKPVKSIAEMYNVEPFVVSLFRTKFQNETPDRQTVLDYEIQKKDETELKRQIAKLSKEEETITLLLESGKTKQAIAAMYNVSENAVSKFQEL